MCEQMQDTSFTNSEYPVYTKVAGENLICNFKGNGHFKDGDCLGRHSILAYLKEYNKRLRATLVFHVMIKPGAIAHFTA